MRAARCRRWLGHKWGIASWPTGERWCERCGAQFSKAYRRKTRGTK